MDTSLNLQATSVPVSSPTPVLDRSVTTKVAPINVSDTATTRPAESPFIAQVVNARLSGTDFPQTHSEIAPPDRTLRPYDVPMLPHAQEPDAGNMSLDSPDSGLQNPAEADQ